MLFDEKLLESSLMPSSVGVRFDIAPEGSQGTDMILELQQFGAYFWLKYFDILVLPELTKTLDTLITGKKVPKNKKPPMIEAALRKDMEIVFIARTEMEQKAADENNNNAEVENAMNSLF
jgi:hypothetical protein